MPSCIDAYRSPCDGGPIRARRSVSGATVSNRCQAHDDAYRAHVEPLVEAINRRYPDTDMPPAWFDPTYAGESWNGDD